LWSRRALHLIALELKSDDPYAEGRESGSAADRRTPSRQVAYVVVSEGGGGYGDRVAGRGAVLLPPRSVAASAQVRKMGFVRAKAQRRDCTGLVVRLRVAGAMVWHPKLERPESEACSDG
jgi:hypothetical protein